MRLICGLFRLDGAPADHATLDAMVAALAAPGLSPQVTRHVDGPAALAVLDFAPPAEGPVTLPHGPDGIRLAADLRLDRPGGPDALDAVTRWGKDLPDRLDGDFALAAWDGRRRRLLLARDIMGVRPLCWSQRPGRLFAFASLPRGLHASGIVAPRPDPLALGQLLVGAASRGAATGFADIAWLRAGHSLEVTPDGLRLHRAWRPTPDQVGHWRGTAADAAAELRTLVEAAVHARLPSAGPVASHLSGGLDSSAISIIAARRLRAEGRRLHAFSHLAAPCRADGLRDEDGYVAAVLAQEPDIVWSPAYAPSFETLGVGDTDLDLTGPLVPTDERVCAAAAAAGAGMVLSGAGGDEGATYNGTGLYAALLRHGRWRNLPAELRARARREGETLPSAVAFRLLAPLLPPWLRQLRRRLLGRPQPDHRPSALDFLAPPLAAQVMAAMPPAPHWRNRPHDRIEMLTESYLAGRNTWWAMAAARHGIAFSYPLLDRRIIDFTLSLPLERFVAGGYARQPFRNAMAGILPNMVRLRAGKFAVYPDLPLLLADSKPALSARLAALRAVPAVADMFNLDAIAAALAAIPEGTEASRIAHAINGPTAIPPVILRSMQALRALKLADQAARLL